jgi:DNA-binding NarL/FixJ family response regulator
VANKYVSERILKREKVIVLVQASVLTVGLDGRNEVLQELPVRLIALQSGIEAARSLKNEKVDSVISKWDLDDMADGQFLKKLRVVKPNIPTIAFVKAGDRAQEIAARSLGVSAVLTDDVDDEFFQETVANVLGLKGVVSIKTISPAGNQKSPLMYKKKL